MLRRTFIGTVGALALAVTGSAAALADGHGHKMDIVDTAVSAESFNTLVAAGQAAGLEHTLRSEGPFTVFAPTDEAFAALSAGTVENLLKPENKDQLVSILTYHVVPAKVGQRRRHRRQNGCGPDGSGPASERGCASWRKGRQRQGRNR